MPLATVPVAVSVQMDSISCFHLSVLGLLITNFFLQGTGDSLSCPSGWLRFQKTCYGVFNTRLSWQDAENACQKYGEGGHLSSILTEVEAVLISRHIMDKRLSSEGIWIGLHDPRRNRKWKWTDFSTVSYLPWNSASLYPSWTEACASLAYATGEKSLQNGMRHHVQ
ncbi:C-type lectin-like [Rhineura floridana]|uniref:C-type lectin-like n=1 Tax=Rhineura floridana TaxID=261503 RepID=UPI002AC7FD96|nr:C-type lectin-like [Rhineura floridana]